MRFIVSMLLFCVVAIAQRIDMAPLKLSLPGPSEGFAWWDQFFPSKFHVVAKAGAALVSVRETTGTRDIKLNLLDWKVSGGTLTQWTVCAARLWPELTPLERVTPECCPYPAPLVVLPYGVGFAAPGDTELFGYGIAVPALGITSWPSDWDSAGGWLRSRDIVISSNKLFSWHPEIGSVTPYMAEWVHAVFEIVP